ncbi:MAG: GNAT family N-acetyltransferase [Clostridia bacterium]|nr:GNAT family N-acetyltransferase [Clostridia bacterium]
MVIRKAEKRDAGGMLLLLSQVLSVHAAIRPDIFIPGTTKYTERELYELIEKSPVYVAAGENGEVLGYAICVLRGVQFSNTMHKRSTLFIDDFCVDENARGRGIGSALFGYVKERARELGCDDITLVVWEGNDSARAFYEKMGMKPKETIMELKV